MYYQKGLKNTLVLEIKLEAYKGSENVAWRISDLVNSGFQELFEAVIVHGSVATEEVITYSDFDGLLIVKDHYLGSDMLNQFEAESSKIINQFDPLQHHGWFMITTSSLKDFDPRILPPSVLIYSKLIYPAQSTVLHLSLMEKSKVDWLAPAQKLMVSLEQKRQKNFPPKGMFNLKGWLSEVMLLPTLVYQAREKQGIFKKYSFEAMRPLYTTEAWHVIELSSLIRREWQYKAKLPFSIFVKLKDKRGIKKFVRNYFAPAIPFSIQNKLDTHFSDSLKLFLEESDKLIKQNRA